MKDTIKAPSIDTGIDIAKMHGHMDIYLTDVKTGKVEEVHEDNMMTNAIQEYFRNCGFLNYPNVNQDSLVPELLGGVIGLSEEIDEDASIVHVPAGNRMIFNGSIGTLNNSAPTELGSYSADESGWQEDGSYVQTYDYSTSQANGTISCVCLTSRIYGYVGEGNSTSLASTATKGDIKTLEGTKTSYSFSDEPWLRVVFNIDLSDSSVCALEIYEEEEEEGGEVVTVKNVYISKYRVPYSKINLKGTQSNLIRLSKSLVTLSDADREIWFAPDGSSYYDGSRWLMNTQSVGANLILWNINVDDEPKWGTDFTQYVWTLTPSGSLTKRTVINTYGDSLYGLQCAYFDGDKCIFIDGHGRDGNVVSDSSKMYVWNMSDNTISSINNPYGHEYTTSSVVHHIGAKTYSNEMCIYHSSGDGRLLVTGKDETLIIDAVNKEVYPTNARSYNEYRAVVNTKQVKNAPLLWTYLDLALYRDITYIASINNLDNPVVKTAEKTMKVIYRITFDEQ